jgi:hypothetical protein
MLAEGDRSEHDPQRAHASPRDLPPGCRTRRHRRQSDNRPRASGRSRQARQDRLASRSVEADCRPTH